MTETIPQPRVAEEGDLADAPADAPALLVYAPLRFEANAVRRGLTQSSSHVQRTGMGATRSRKSAAQSQPGPFGAMVVMGTAAGLAADLSPGDLVVATEVTDGETTVTLPGADLLAAELRRAGLNARAGRIVQVKKIVSSSERTRLAADGYLAADMESAAIVAAVKGLAPSAQQPAESAELECRRRGGARGRHGRTSGGRHPRGLRRRLRPRHGHRRDGRAPLAAGGRPGRRAVGRRLP